MIHSSVFKRYALFYVGVALMACGLVGFFQLSLSAGELRNAEQAALNIRIEAAKKDFDAQVNKLYEVSVEVKANSYCNPRLFTENAIREKEMIEALDRIGSNSAWKETLYVYYPDADAVYCGKAKYRLHYFLHYGVSTAEKNALLEKMTLPDRAEWFDLGNGQYMLFFPITFSNYTGGWQNATVMFLLSNEQIERQTELLSGLSCSVTPYDAGDVPDGYRICQTSAFNMMVSEPYGLYERSRKLITVSLWILVSLCLLSVGVALILAYMSYRPIRRMTLRYGLNQEKRSDELELLDSALNHAIDEKKVSQRELMEYVRTMDQQKRSIRQQVLGLLLSGKLEDDQAGVFANLNINLPGPHFTVLLLKMNQATPFEEIEEMAEELSDEDVSFCPLKMDGEIVLLTSLAERGMVAEAVDVLEGARDAAGYDFEVFCGTPVGCLQQIHDAYLSTRSGAEDGRECGLNDRWYDDGSLQNLLDALKKAQMDEVRERIWAMGRSISERCATQAMCRCAYVDVFTRLIQFALDQKLPVPSELCGNALVMMECGEFVEVVECAVNKMLSGGYITSDRDELSEAIVQYVNEHVCELSFSSVSLADQFHLSTKHAAALLKERTGLNYKSYVLRLRMQEACRLLGQTKIPIAEIHERVGYSSSSHFVKVFKNTTGMTPSVYRSMGGLVQPTIRLELDEM